MKGKNSISFFYVSIIYVMAFWSSFYFSAINCSAQIIFSENFENNTLPAGWTISGTGNVLSVFNGASAYGLSLIHI